MRYMTIKPVDVANGLGVRVSLFVSGCNHRCTGCFNEEAWDFESGEVFTYRTLDELIDLCKHDYIRGISFLGGEPLHPKNAPTVALICREFKCLFRDTKDIWIYTGYDFDEISHLDAVNHADVIVDGRFIPTLYDPHLRFKGSSNQRIIDVKKTLKTGDVVTLDA